MSTATDPRQALSQIQDIMERSSRFVQLSGWSLVTAGMAGLVGAVTAWQLIRNAGARFSSDYYVYDSAGIRTSFAHPLGISLLTTGMITLVAALLLSWYFTWRRARRLGVPVWPATANRLAGAMIIPLIAGGLFLLKLYLLGISGMIGPGSLIFYGLSVVAASAHSYRFFRHMGLIQILLGLVSMQFPGMGIAFWALGFGLVHVGFGLWMVWKLDKSSVSVKF